MRESIAVSFLVMVTSLSGVALAGGPGDRPAPQRERPTAERHATPRERIVLEKVNPEVRGAPPRASKPVDVSMKESGQRLEKTKEAPVRAPGEGRAGPVINPGDGQTVLPTSSKPGGGQSGGKQGGSGFSSPQHTEHQKACHPGDPACGTDAPEKQPQPAAAKTKVYTDAEAKAIGVGAKIAAEKAAADGKALLMQFMRKAMCARVGGDMCG